MIQIGDTVRFLNAVGGGRVAKINGNMAYVIDEDGFETPVLLRECVVVARKGDQPTTNRFVEVPKVEVAMTAMPPVVVPPTPEPEPEPPLPIEETPEGEKLNVVLAFEPRDIKRLSTTEIDAHLVNDSNYFLHFTILTRSEDDDRWTLFKTDTVEPNIQLYLGEMPKDLLPRLGRIVFQYIAYKSDRPFALKQPALIEKNIDNTKFYKLHCFTDNVYFDTPVLALDLVRDDVPQSMPRRVDPKALEREMMAKKQAEVRKPIARPVRKKAVKANDDIIEVDLHINELIDNTRGLSNADMLNLQVDEFRRVMDENLKNKGQRIVFIHGKGEGVLRQALLKELNHRYKGNDVQDASFKEYGFGATQVTIR